PNFLPLMWDSSSSSSWAVGDDLNSSENYKSFESATKTITDEKCRKDPVSGETRCEIIRRFYKQTHPGGPLEEVESTRRETTSPQHWSSLFEDDDDTINEENKEVKSFPALDDDVGHPDVRHLMNLFHRRRREPPHETIVVEQTKPGLGEEVFLALFGSMVKLMFRHLECDFATHGTFFGSAADRKGSGCYEV
ncbi:hypothetical protein Pmar_PMAR002574, partial [Perkinsus marinus ATCC 50983]